VTPLVRGSGEPLQLNLLIDADTDWAVELDWTNDSGEPMPTTGFDMQVEFERYEGGVYPPDLSVSNDGGITISESGVIVWQMSRSTVETLDFYSTSWRAYLEDALTTRRLWGQGRIRLKRNPTSLPPVPILTIEQGIARDLIFEPFDDDARTLRSDIDPASWRVVLQARRFAGSTTAVLSLDTTDGTGRLINEPATDGAPGRWIRMSLGAEDTAALPAGQLLYQLARIDLNDPNNTQSLIEPTPLSVTRRMIT
jgi:hypothetical protein